MSALLTLTDPVTLTVLHTQVLADGGIFDTANGLTSAAFALLKNVASFSILLAFLWIAHKQRFAAGAVIGGLLACGLIFFAVNGGLAWIGTEITTQLSSTSGLGTLTSHSLD